MTYASSSCDKLCARSVNDALLLSSAIIDKGDLGQGSGLNIVH
jgi:hypothetical protein